MAGPLRLITVTDGYVNLIHETLIRTKGLDTKGSPDPYWPTLWQYIDANKRRAALKQRLGMAASEWDQKRGVRRLLGLSNWVDLASLVGMKGLGELERKYRRWSLVNAAAWLGIVLTIMGILVEAYYWKAKWGLPFEANLTRWAFHLGVELPLPDLARIPPEGVDHDGVVDPRLPFYMGTTETTFEQYDAFCEVTGRSKLLDEGWGQDRQPVINVDWNDAYAYTRWLSAMTGADCRLPTEVEWACRDRKRVWDTGAGGQ